MPTLAMCARRSGGSALKLHPDRGGDPEAFRRASQAAELLLGSDSHVDPGSSEPPIKQRGNVRGFFALDGVVAVVDEACASIQGEAIVRSAHDEVLLCGCALGSQACVGTSKGRIYLAGERGVRTLVGGGPAVLALAASAAPPLLVASIAGETTLLEAAEGGAVRSLAADIFGVLRAEAICALPRGCGDGAAALFVVGGSGDAEAEGGFGDRLCWTPTSTARSRCGTSPSTRPSSRWRRPRGTRRGERQGAGGGGVRRRGPPRERRGGRASAAD